MQAPIELLQKKFLTFFQRLSVEKWQYTYYALAVFNLLTVSSSLYLNHKIMDIYSHSIEVNQQWAVRLATYSELGELLATLNAPGNNVFDSHNVEIESNKLNIAQQNYEKKIRSIRQELKTHSDSDKANHLLKNLDEVVSTTEEMVAEAQLIFSYFRQNQLEMAGRRMATMDHQYHQVNRALATFRRSISQIQQQLLEEQQVAANSFRHYEFAIAGAVLLMMSGVTWYGHQLARKMKAVAQAKEQSIAELQQAETLLKEQAQQLQLTLEDLQKTQLKLVQSEKMSSLGQLVAGVAHEINNPVNFIHGNLNHVHEYAQDLLNFVQLYQKHYPNPVAEIQAEAQAIDLEFLQEDLAKILSSMQVGTDRIRQIVLSLRNFSRMDEAGLKEVDIHEGLDSTLMILQHRLKAHANCPAIKVIQNYAKLPLVECYPGQLNQVFMNILANAIDALEEVTAQRTSQGRKDNPHLTIRTSMLNQEWVEISISDNGTGIPKAIQQRIFDPFFTTKPVGKGTGMGMSISYQIIAEKHGGKLKCFSTPGEGTEFVIEIPIRKATPEAPEANHKQLVSCDR